MLIKTIKFDDDVIDTIAAMDWRDNGTLGILPPQLERKLYERTNKALTAMGGKWNRSRGGHVFPSDPRPQVDGLLASGSLSVDRDGFFETPLAVVARMIELVIPWGRILEPEAGTGAIADNLPVDKSQIVCVERNAERSNVLTAKGYTVHNCDFLTYHPDRLFDRIYMNPPFEEGQDIDHVRHAYDCLAYGAEMAAVMSPGPFFRSDRKATDFRSWFKDRYVEELPANSFKENGTGAATRLVILYKS